jgi:hypothetical protein
MALASTFTIEFNACQFQALQQTDNTVRQIKLAWQEVVARGCGPKVMVVMPSFSQSENADECIVLTVVFRVLERLLVPEVTDGVNAPRDVVIEEKPHNAHSDERIPAEAEWHSQTRRQP